ncbi:MAG: rhodanese-like domain-containing protein [Halobacteria archaeon]|nr:rhodanese-like domain-containing protein [Halobacteria archaeon]
MKRVEDTEGATQRQQDIPQASADEAKELVESDDYFVLDVRNPDEHEEKRIPGTDRLVPVKIIDGMVDKIDADSLLVYCRSGSRSMRACRQLVDGDFDEVVNLDGGINGWIDDGFEVERGS